MARYSFDPLTKTFAELTPEEDAAMSPRSRMIGGREVALTRAEAASLEAAELASQLDSIYATKSAEFEAAYIQTTEAGFVSAALGTDHTYASSQTAQMDLIGIKACNRARRVWCNDGNAWGLVMHTAAQIETVINDGADIKEQAFDNLITKQAAVEAVLAGPGTDAEKLAAIQAITW